MVLIPVSDSIVTATACEVLPRLGLVYLVDDHNQSHAITGSTKGPGLGGVQLGQRCQLTLADHGSFTSVCEYRLLS